MKRMRWITAMLLALLLLALGAAASAATRLPQYSLVVNGKHEALSAETGYLFRSGSALMVPVEAVCKLMGIEYTQNQAKTAMTMTADNGAEVKIQLRSRSMFVDELKRPLRMATVHQLGRHLTADVQVLRTLGLKIRHYKAGAETRKLGYPGGVLAIAEDAAGLKLPDISTTPPEPPEPPEVKFDDAILDAAANATQIVGVKYNAKSKSAKFTFYQKVDGKLREFYSGPAYVGRNGIGKQAEGDYKTPTGTFNLTQPFGRLKDPGTKLGKYTQVVKNHHYWAGQNGPYYNRMVDLSKVKDYKPNASMDEHLYNIGAAYNYCAFIDYNAEGVADKGSAIFLHCMGSKKYTAGCVAVRQEVMRNLLKTLKPGAKIVIYA
ncbi:L,D-transpeptidase [Bacillota bacterium Meth-B3]